MPYLLFHLKSMQETKYRKKHLIDLDYDGTIIKKAITNSWGVKRLNNIFAWALFEW